MTAAVHKPLRHHRIVSGVSFLLLFAAFVLYLLVALSLPIIKGIYLLELKATVAPNQPNTSIGSELRFGVWGVCVTRYVPLSSQAEIYVHYYHYSAVRLMSQHFLATQVFAQSLHWDTRYLPNIST